MRCPLLRVVGMQNMQTTYFTHVAVQIRAAVSIVTLSRRHVRAELRLLAHIWISAGRGGTLQTRADGVQVSVRLALSAVVSVVPALCAFSSAVRLTSGVTTQS